MSPPPCCACHCPLSASSQPCLDTRLHTAWNHRLDFVDGLGSSRGVCYVPPTSWCGRHALAIVPSAWAIPASQRGCKGKAVDWGEPVVRSFVFERTPPPTRDSWLDECVHGITTQNREANRQKQTRFWAHKCSFRTFCQNSFDTRICVIWEIYQKFGQQEFYSMHI